MKNIAIKTIKKILQKRGIKVKKIILYGSRARNDFHKDSDWDFLVIINKDLDFNEKTELTMEIKRGLAKLKIPNDLVIKSENLFNLMKDYVGNISFYASKEGIEL